VLLLLIFRNPEFGHQLDTKSVEACVANRGPGTVIGAIVGAGSCHRTRLIVRATPPTRTMTRPGRKVMGDTNDTSGPNTRSHTGMIAVRLNSIDMVLLFLVAQRKRGGSLARLAE
jgi:hypothetical protein